MEPVERESQLPVGKGMEEVLTSHLHLLSLH